MAAALKTPKNLNGTRDDPGGLRAYLFNLWKCTAAEEPEKPWPGPMWEFTRGAKAYPSLSKLSALEAAEVVEKCLSEFPKHQTSHDRDLWSTWFEYSDDPRMEFISGWDKVRSPRGTLDCAQESAQKRPLIPTNNYSRGYAAFLSIAGHLQRLNPDRNILLPCHKLAPMLGCEPRTISRYRQMAQVDGLLIQKAPGNQYGKATEFRFRVELFDFESTGQQLCCSDGLALCVTSETPATCHTETQETEDNARRRRNADTQEMHENDENKENKGARFPQKRPPGPHIPSRDELIAINRAREAGNWTELRRLTQAKNALEAMES